MRTNGSSLLCYANIINVISRSRIRGHWDAIVKDYGVGSFTLPSIVKSITSSFSTKYRLKQLQDFMKQHPDQASAKRAFKQAVEKTQTNIDWQQKNYDNVVDWLKKQSL